MKQWISKANVIRLIGVICSAVLLAASFPPLGESQAAWLGVMPLILVARSTSPGRAFYWGWISGALFWLISLAWLWRLGVTGCPFVVAALAWLALAMYLALFRGAFAATTAWAFKVMDTGRREGEPAPFSRTLPMVLIVPILWVGFEYLRGVIGTGFAWNGLGISQYRNLPVLQLAEWGGVPLVSGVIVAANTGIALMLARVSGVYMGARRVRVQFELMVVLLLMAVVWSVGVRRVRALRASAGEELRSMRVVAIQPNVPQLKKWPDAFESEIYGALEDRMDLVTALQAEIDLVIWPETALPGFLPDDSEVDTFVRQLVRETGTPLLVGAMEIGGRHPRGDGADPDDVSKAPQPWDWILHNSSFLYAADGTLVGRYRKQHLVPFGEYLPMDQHWSWVRRLEPLGFSCTPGRESTVLAVETPAGATIPFSSLICFEDVFAGVARGMVRNGARLLVNQTNDAWFDGSVAAVQHMSHCVFRCVENRVPAVRAANTGVTCFIDRTGQIDETSRGILKRKEWTLIDYRSETVAVPRDDMVPTFYTRFGDWPLAIPSAILALVASVMTWRQSKKEHTI